MRIFLVMGIVFGVVLLSCKRPNRGGAIGRESMDLNEKDRRNYTSRSENVIRMTKNRGVYEVPIKVNGVEMEFIFDTGASSISISGAEALFLYKQGKLSDSDFKGTIHFQDATGNISEGTSINLKSVRIGNREIKNVEASVVHNMSAPLLLGQSALAQFGKVTIDYKRNTLQFE